MIILPLVVVVALTGQKAPSLFDEVIKNPTGQNGYEEYVRAVEICTDPQFTIYNQWTPTQYEEMVRSEEEEARIVSGGETPTASTEDKARWKARRELIASLRNADYPIVYQAMVRRYGKAIELVKQGNMKPCYDPRTSIDFATTFRELSGFRSISRLFNADAYLRFSKGDSRGAVTDLLESMTFNRRSGVGIMVHDLVGISGVSVALSMFNDNLNVLSASDADRIVAYAESVLAEAPRLVSVLESERRFALSSIDGILDNPANQFGVDEEDLPDDASGEVDSNAIVRAIKRWGVSERERFRVAYRGIVNRQFDMLISKIGSDESKWLAAFPSEDEELQMPAGTDAKSILSSPEGIATYVAESTKPTFRGWVLAHVRTRAQMRLLELHARIIGFRWRFKRLPKSLDEVAPASVCFDPLSGQPFAYEPGDGVYKLYSKGIDETGPIALRYRRLPDTEVEPASP